MRLFLIRVLNNINNDNFEPKGFGEFNKSRKDGPCYLFVLPDFINRFCFLISQDKKPCFELMCKTIENRTLSVQWVEMCHFRIVC